MESNADVFGFMLLLLIIAWVKIPTSCHISSYFPSSCHRGTSLTAGARSGICKCIVVLEGDTIDASNFPKIKHGNENVFVSRHVVFPMGCDLGQYNHLHLSKNLSVKLFTFEI